MLFASDSGKREYSPWVWYSWSNLRAKLHSTWASHNNRIPIFILYIVRNRDTNSSPFAWNRSRVSETQRHMPIVNLRVYHPCYDAQKTEHWFGLKFHLIPGWRGEQYSGYISNTVLCKESVSHGWRHEEGLRYLQVHVIPVIRNLSKHLCTPYHYLTTVVNSTYLFFLDFWVQKRHVEQSFLSKKRTWWRGAWANLKFPPQSVLEYSDMLTINSMYFVMSFSVSKLFHVIFQESSWSCRIWRKETANSTACPNRYETFSRMIEKLHTAIPANTLCSRANVGKALEHKIHKVQPA